MPVSRLTDLALLGRIKEGSKIMKFKPWMLKTGAVLKAKPSNLKANSKGKGAMLVVTSFAVANIGAVLGIMVFVAVRRSVCKVQRKRQQI